MHGASAELLRGLADAAGREEEEAGVRVCGRAAAHQRHPQEHPPAQGAAGTAATGMATGPQGPTAVTLSLHRPEQPCRVTGACVSLTRSTESCSPLTSVTDTFSYYSCNMGYHMVIFIVA